MNYNAFVKNSSFAGLFILYACQLSNDKQKAFNLKDFTNKVGSFSPLDYFYGYIMACTAANLVTLNYSKDIVTVSKFESSLKEVLLPELKLRLSGEFERFKNNFDALEEYFVD